MGILWEYYGNSMGILWEYGINETGGFALVKEPAWNIFPSLVNR